MNLDFHFLSNPAGFQIAQSWLPASPDDTYGWLLLAGLSNTLLVVGIALPLASLLGLLIGAMRLHSHPLLARAMAALVEPIRNTPVLLQLFAWYALLLNLPHVTQAWAPLPGVFLSNRGLILPGLHADATAVRWLAAALAATAMLALWRHRASPHARRTWGTLAGTMLVTTAWLTAALHLTLEWPVRQGLGLRGGWTLSPELSALLLGLSVFHAAYLSDIVCSAVRSVPFGQVQAARALGMPPLSVARYAILPFALRSAIPPFGNQCLMLLKNSTLAIAIGFQEVMAIINTSITQTGRALEGMLLALGFYVGVGVPIAAFLAHYNRHHTRHGIDGLGAARFGQHLTLAPLSRTSLFGSSWRTVLTLCLVLAGSWLVQEVSLWLAFDAAWRGGVQACAAASGACWPVLGENWRLLVFGTMEPIFRPTSAWAAMLTVAGALASMSGLLSARWRAWLALLCWAAAAMCLGGAIPALPAVPTVQWGGIIVTVVLASTCVVLSVPLSIPLALMRRSHRIWLSAPAAMLIEPVRAVPLITQLVLAAFLIPSFLGDDWSGSKFQIAVMVLVVHTTCQLAEVLRGALQAIPHGQLVAARALGMSYSDTLRTILLPQARRIAAPAALGVFVGAIKDTSLVMVIGLFDVLSAAKAVLASTTWRPYYVEVYLAVGLIYFAACFGLSRVAQRMR